MLLVHLFNFHKPLWLGFDEAIVCDNRSGVSEFMLVFTFLGCDLTRLWIQNNKNVCKYINQTKYD